MILSGQDFPLERLQQQPDIRHPLELARTLDGGIPISPAVIVGEGEMVYHQMLRPDGLFDEVTALPKSHPREVQKGQINGAVADEIPQLRVRHGAVSGDQDPETVIFQDTAVVGDLPVLCTLVSQAHEVHVQPLQGEMAAGTGQHQLAVKLLLRQHQGHLRISGNHLLCQGAGVMVRMAVGEKEQIRAGEVRMSLKNVPALRGDSGEPHNPTVVERVGPDPHGTQMQGDLTAIGVKHMKKMGMEFNLECPVQAVEASPVGAKVTCRNKAGETVSFEAEKVLVAIGRKANTASLNLEAAGLANDRGRIIVNDKMETSVPGVYAIGDCVFGKAQLAHTASAMGEVAAENIMGIPAVYDEKTNPTCVYMEPEAASVGLTEEQCKAKGIDYKVGKFPLVANGKSLIINGGEGLVKIIADAKYEEVLGMHIIGPRATDLIAEGALALRLEATVDELISTIHSHPTVSESVRECALNVQKRAIHIKN